LFNFMRYVTASLVNSMFCLIFRGMGF
jgi:hypothetical protein